MRTASQQSRTFIELFAGCGGLSLGLKRAGWEGIFAVEKDRFAFQTLERNFIGESARYRYTWPQWLPKQPWDIERLLMTYRKELQALRGRVTLVAGGPPCQGFSSAGKRLASDPRNSLLNQYIRFVSIVQPRYLILENVRGFTLDFRLDGGQTKNFADLLVGRLRRKYVLYTGLLTAADFGVPQNRRRFILIGIRKDASQTADEHICLKKARDLTLATYGIRAPVSARAAISDLETARAGIVASQECVGFRELSYIRPYTKYQKAMRDGHLAAPSDTRLARHAAVIKARFARIIAMCHQRKRRNRQLSPEMRDHFSLRKVAIRVLDPARPAPTITSMPDDLLHYAEPRTLTVRENARLQSFPDWFAFQGKYTTGGALRRREVPRFTQVANAVPPLLAEALGRALAESVLTVADQAGPLTLQRARLRTSSKTR